MTPRAWMIAAGEALHGDPETQKAPGPVRRPSPGLSVRKDSLHAQRGQAASTAALCSAIALAVTGVWRTSTARSTSGG